MRSLTLLKCLLLIAVFTAITVTSCKKNNEEQHLHSAKIGAIPAGLNSPSKSLNQQRSSTKSPTGISKLAPSSVLNCSGSAYFQFEFEWYGYPDGYYSIVNNFYVGLREYLESTYPDLTFGVGQGEIHSTGGYLSDGEVMMALNAGWQFTVSINSQYSPTIKSPLTLTSSGSCVEIPVLEPVTIKTDSLKAKFPCAVKLVIDVLNEIPLYKQMSNPFSSPTFAPHLQWNAKPLNWGVGGQYHAGHTAVLPGSFTGMSSEITLNSNMIVNASQILVAATAIHETYHAYIQYYFAMGTIPPSTNPSDMAFMRSFWDYITYANNGDTNFDTHRMALDSQFDNFVSILRDQGGKNIITGEYNYSLSDARKALLVGMNNAGPSATPNQVLLIQQYYNSALTRYGLTSTDVDNFLLANSPAPVNKRIPTTCP